MATSFKDIYKRFLFGIEDDGIAYLEKKDFYDLLQNYITQGSTLDFKECRKSLDYSEGGEFINNFFGDGVKREFLLYNPTHNEIVDCVVLVNGEIIDECYYIITDDINRVEGGFEIPEFPEQILPDIPLEDDESTNDDLLDYPLGEEDKELGVMPIGRKLIIPEQDNVDDGFLRPTKANKYIQFAFPINDGDKVEVILKELGYFKEDLSNEEIMIIAETMKLHWIRKQILREDNLRASISTSDFKKTSNANLLDKLILLEDRTQKNIKEYKVNYSMEDFEGFF